MLKALFFSLLLSAPFLSFAGFRIASDLDDTIKITNSAEGLPASYNGVFTQKAFAGMPELLRWHNFGKDFIVVTASPRALKERVEDLLEKFQLKPAAIHLRRVFKEGKIAFKVRVLSAWMNSHQDDVILMGDDAGEDPEIYNEIEKLFPGRVSAIYIRPVTGRSFDGQAFKYFSALDIAGQELLFGRFNLENYLKLAEVMKEAKIRTVIPKFAYCPTVDSSWNTGADETAQSIRDYIIDICLARNPNFPNKAF